MQRPFHRDPKYHRMLGCARPRPLVCCRFMPRPCIGVRSPGVLLRQLRHATFKPPISTSQALYPNALPRRHTSPVPRDLDQPASEASSMLLHERADNISPVIRALSDTLSPRHARQPIPGMKRQSIYIIVMYICSWRSTAWHADMGRI